MKLLAYLSISLALGLGLKQEEELLMPGDNQNLVELQRQLADSVNTLQNITEEAYNSLIKIIFGELIGTFYDSVNNCEKDETNYSQLDADDQDEEANLFHSIDSDDVLKEIEGILDKWEDNYDFTDSLCKTEKAEEWLVGELLQDIFEDVVECDNSDQRLAAIIEEYRNEYVLGNLNDDEYEGFLFLRLKAKVTQETQVSIEEVEDSFKPTIDELCAITGQIDQEIE